MCLVMLVESPQEEGCTGLKHLITTIQQDFFFCVWQVYLKSKDEAVKERRSPGLKNLLSRSVAVSSVVCIFHFLISAVELGDDIVVSGVFKTLARLLSEGKVLSSSIIAKAQSSANPVPLGAPSPQIL
jgi:hypothetical protein